MSLLPNQDTFGKTQLSVIEDVPNIIDESIEGTIYIGYAERGTLTNQPFWRIKRVQSEAGITTIGYVNGKLNFNFIWDNRTEYDYL
jgi:hypothetical protein